MAEGARVRLRIYDATRVLSVGKANNVLKSLGTGIFHSAVEVYGMEWGYGGCLAPGQTGVYRSEPGRDAQHTYREVLELGRTPLSEGEVQQVLERLQEQWLGTDYHILRHNCSHFSESLCEALHVDPVPLWVKSLARVGAELDAVSEAVVPHVRSQARLLRPWGSFLAVKRPELGVDWLARIKGNLAHFQANYLMATIVLVVLFLLNRPRRLLGTILAFCFWVAMFRGRDPCWTLQAWGLRLTLPRVILAGVVSAALALALVKEVLLISALLALAHAAAHPGGGEGAEGEEATGLPPAKSA